ncbi:hypothetical protein [Chelativorans sp. Marseille-P2723]|uniref:hypothetical protein n=1 Tax=Chelativorans sp. Marseille-P2723 TaxID=2709133 RepID=UPI001FEE22A7|nr:hypothetical protein [Chelativorans sp. Marseille-P2723]
MGRELSSCEQEGRELRPNPLSPDPLPPDPLRPRVSIAGRRVPLPRSRTLRIASGLLLVLGGVLGFLPILGFWMVPLGLLFLSYDIPLVRRMRRRIEVWWYRRGADRR